MKPAATTSSAWDFLVDRADLRRRVLRDAEPDGRLLDGDVRIRVDAFALTANNLTYAVTGDRFGYWRLFPADADWGRIPAWGVGTVERSECPDVGVGERFAGMVPMSTHFIAHPRVNRDGFTDRATHRADVNPVYNRYVCVTGRADTELERDAALRPVYILSFVLARHLRTSDWLGAARLLVTSASSKASLGLAHALSSADVSVVGLTSSRHVELVTATGLYDDIVAYDRIATLLTAPTSALIDVSGGAAVRHALRQHLGRRLIDTVHVGQTDWDQPADELLGATGGAAPFSAPTAIQQLVGEWGPAEFARRLDADLRTFTAHSRRWLDVEHRDGRTAMTGAFDDVADGAVPPDRFIIVRPTTAHR